MREAYLEGYYSSERDNKIHDHNNMMKVNSAMRLDHGRL